MVVQCSKCKKDMTIDEPEGESYITKGLMITFNEEGLILNIDETNKTYKHVNCKHQFKEENHGKNSGRTQKIN